MSNDLEKRIDRILFALNDTRRAFLRKLLVGGCIGVPLISSIGLMAGCQDEGPGKGKGKGEGPGWIKGKGEGPEEGIGKGEGPDEGKGKGEGPDGGKGKVRDPERG
jgi:hypothetical protein